MTLPPIRDELGDTLRRIPGRVFAVLDGAHFSDLPQRLRAVRLDYYPLYLDETDAPNLDAGPHLVVCRNGYAIEQVRDVAAGAPTVVWWAWPASSKEPELQIYRHLRRLNLMDVPSSATGEREGAPGDGLIQSAGTAEPLLLRYADPDVVAALLPVLAPVQRARFFGGAEAIIAQTSGDGGLLVANNPKPDAPVPFGRMRLSTDQYAVLGEAYRSGLRRRAVLEFTKTAGPDRASLAARVCDALARAERYGCATQAQAWEFIRMDMRFGAKFELTPRFKGVLAQLQETDRPIAERLFRAEQELGFAMAGNGAA